MDIGIVKALNVDRQHLQAEIRHHSHKRALHTLLRIMLLHHLEGINLVLTGIVSRHFKQLQFVATLRHIEYNSIERNLREHRHKYLIIFEPEFLGYLHYGVT